MERLAARIGESVFLGMPQGDRVIILSCTEGRNELRVSSPSGTTLPLLAAATGKVFLSSLPGEEAEKILRSRPLPAFTERSIRDPERFLREVDEVRVRGYATDDEEYLRGVRAVAAPVKLHGDLVAILWIVGFSSSLDAAAMERAGEELVEAASLLSRLLETGPGQGDSSLFPEGHPIFGKGA
jgi:DNA-binding IclR family transcriptional regulator